MQRLSLHLLSSYLTLGSLMALTVTQGCQGRLQASLQLPSAPPAYEVGASGPEEGPGVVFLYSHVTILQGLIGDLEGC